MTFVAQDITQQTSSWKQGWRDFKATLNGEITILGLHATYISSVLGLRCPVSIPLICEDFQPTLIISLVDDVYNMWHRTEVRAAGRTFLGRPSFEQLLVGRRAEQLLGDVILSHAEAGHTRHILCAVGNNIDALTNLIIFDAPATYLSFPISVPRKTGASGDTSFIELINDAHKAAAAEMASNRRKCFISPLAIDELPIVKIVSDAASEMVAFDCRVDRWRLDSLWGDEELLILPPPKGKLQFPALEIQGAAGVMQTDVGWRDRRLVLQSNTLAIVCPKPPGEERVTRGVKEEISTAIMMGIVCNVWQKPEWDIENFVGKEIFDAGSMGIGQTQATVQRFDTLEAFIAANP